MSRFLSTKNTFAALVAMSLAAGAALAPSTAGAGSEGRKLFIESATENPDDTATFPLQRGTSRGQTVWYFVLDSSDGKDAALRGVNHSSKLNNARGTAAVQKVTMIDGMVDFPASVDFRLERQVVPGPQGFPPLVAEPGAVGQDGYSPLIELPNGTILNAPHIANDSGRADKVVDLDTASGSVTYRETRGFQGGKAVKYVSTDASNPVAAALEGVTFAPVLDAAPFAGGDGTDSSRASLAAFVNGQTGANERQGLNSALLDGLDPLNVLRWNPSQGRYSPLWDVHLAAWRADVVANGQNVLQRSFNDVRGLAKHGMVTSPDGTAFGPAGFIVNCPVVSME